MNRMLRNFRINCSPRALFFPDCTLYFTCDSFYWSSWDSGRQESLVRWNGGLIHDFQNEERPNIRNEKPGLIIVVWMDTPASFGRRRSIVKFTMVARTNSDKCYLCSRAVTGRLLLVLGCSSSRKATSGISTQEVFPAADYKSPFHLSEFVTVIFIES